MKSDNSITRNYKLITFLSIVFVVFSVVELKSENLKKVVNLEGTWRFSIGDNPNWSKIEFEPKNWDYVSIPQRWESAGYLGYDGYAWYRKEFKIENSIDHKNLYLVLGYIDDVDEVYLNGNLIGGTGVMPPVVKTSFTVMRKYPITKDLLNLEGENVIAIRVFDEYETGGIYKGPLGIFFDEDSELLMKNLSGDWNIEESSLSKDNKTLFIPGNLESRGFHSLDGTISFTKEFTIPENTDLNDLLLVLGYIDGAERVYLNGNVIGNLDQLRNSKNREFPPVNILRGYDINRGQLKSGVNILEVIIDDNDSGGGIIEGPVGLIYKDDFNNLKSKQVERTSSPWEEFLKYLWE